jgi:hypothetical protein
VTTQSQQIPIPQKIDLGSFFNLVFLKTFTSEASSAAAIVCPSITSIRTPLNVKPKDFSGRFMQDRLENDAVKMEKHP